MVWHHCDSSGLVLSFIRLFADFPVGVGLGCVVVNRCTFHISSTPLWVSSRTRLYFLYTLMWVAVNVALHESSNIFPVEISAPYCRWG